MTRTPPAPQTDEAPGNGLPMDDARHGRGGRPLLSCWGAAPNRLRALLPDRRWRPGALQQQEATGVYPV
jgi:hypothetical protein